MMLPLRTEVIDDNELVSWLRLARTNNVGPITFFTLIEAYQSPAKAIKALKENISAKIRLPDEDECWQELESTRKMGGKILCFNDRQYPKLLRTIKDPPPVITVFGDTDLLNKPSIAIVGSRSCSINGYKFAESISLDLAKSGYVIVSGLASGIDTAAHKVINDNHPTIAVMANGIDQFYPLENQGLYQKIGRDGGLLITEMPFGCLPKAQFFPRRNRIIAGLCVVIAIIETGNVGGGEGSSGSIITANYALDYGREVFAVPGFPLDPRYKGNNELIKNGARLLGEARDILELLAFSPNLVGQHLDAYITDRDLSTYLEAPLPSRSKIIEIKSSILKCLSNDPTLIEDVVVATKIPTNIMLVALVELELEGKIIRHYGNKVSIKY